MVITRRYLFKLAVPAAIGCLIPNSLQAAVDPGRLAAKYPSLLNVGFVNFRLLGGLYRIGMPVAFSADLDLTAAITNETDEPVVSGTVACYIDDGSAVEEALKIFGPFKFTPDTVPSYPLQASGPSPRKAGRKRLVLLSANTYVSRPFTVE